MNKIFALTVFTLFILFSNAQPPLYNVTEYAPASRGYYFLCPYKITAFPNFPPGNQNHMILDDKGNLIYYCPISGYFGGDFKLHPNGLMSFAGQGKFYIMDSTFTIIDSVSIQGAGYQNDLHDLQILDNGHYLLMGTENIQMDLSNHFVFLGNHSPGSANATVLAGIVQELDENKNVVFEWHSMDYYQFDDVDEFFMGDTAHVDWTHMNAVEMDTDGNIMVSNRHFSEVTKISRTDSSIIWRMGGKANQFNFTNDPSMFLSQHDIRRNADGTISLFDNGRNGLPVHKASSKIYTIDEANHELVLMRSHSEGSNIWSRSQGNVQILSNGNILSSYGNLDPDPIVFNVVDSNDAKVFEIMFPDSQITYRTFNYETLPWQLNLPTLHCFVDSAGTGHLATDSTFANYLWSTGETTAEIQVNAADTFYVYVPKGNGFIRSEIFIVEDAIDPCGVDGISSVPDKNNFNLFPNPTNGEITIQFSKIFHDDVVVYDLTGREMKRVEGNAGMLKMDFSGFTTGIYIVKCGASYKKVMLQNE
jgi:hypothetical protein